MADEVVLIGFLGFVVLLVGNYVVVVRWKFFCCGVVKGCFCCGGGGGGGVLAKSQKPEGGSLFPQNQKGVLVGGGSCWRGFLLEGVLASVILLADFGDFCLFWSLSHLCSTISTNAVSKYKIGRESCRARV